MTENRELEPEQLLTDFYVSSSYDPKAARPADTVLAAIAYTLTRASVEPRLAQMRGALVEARMTFCLPNVPEEVRQYALERIDEALATDVKEDERHAETSPNIQEALIERLNAFVQCGCCDDEWPQLRHDTVAALSTSEEEVGRLRLRGAVETGLEYAIDAANECKGGKNSQIFKQIMRDIERMEEALRVTGVGR